MAQKNHEMSLAWQFLEGTQTSVFLTGKAGTGKTTFLKTLREHTSKRTIVLAPTGVAAINAEGQTIHSFFQLPFTPFIPGAQREEQQFFRFSKEKKNIIRTLDLLVIDEISMVRADLLDAIDDVMRRFRNHTLPFGGVQLLLIGDLQQLAPVAKDDEWQLLSRYYDTPYFFGSRALKQIPLITIELQHIYRQQDPQFISLLADIRNNNITEQTMQLLNSRYIPNFREPDNEDWIRLTTHNNTAQQHNDMRMAMLSSPSHAFDAEISGNFPEYSYPTDAHLMLKVGAQVMFVKNDTSTAHRFYNGKIGRITAFKQDGIDVMCKGDSQPIFVEQMTWENMRYTINDETKAIEEEVEGTFRQFPLRLAWAITVHKSQGLTFDHAVIDINHAFAHGQTYVALSRCRTLNGMVLTAPLNQSSVITDSNVNAFIESSLSEQTANEQKLPTLRRQYFHFLLDELFFMQPIEEDIQHLYRVACQHLYNHSESYVDLLHTTCNSFQKDVSAVSVRFKQQYDSILTQCADNYATSTLLQERIHKAAEYFLTHINELCSSILTASSRLTIDNKAIKKQFGIAVDALVLSYQVKKVTLQTTIEKGFSTATYLNSKAEAVLAIEGKNERTPRTRNGRNRTGRSGTSRTSSSRTASSSASSSSRNTSSSLTPPQRFAGMTPREILQELLG